MEATSPDTVIISTNTEEEPDSPHYSILEAFRKMGAEIHVTQDYDIGIHMTIHKDGTYEIRDAHIETEPAASLEIVSASKTDQTTVIRNTGDAEADISRYFLFSERGSEIFVFPPETVIGAGEEITVACSGSDTETPYIWKEKRVWNKNKDDNAVLYDISGNILDQAESK